MSPYAQLEFANLLESAKHQVLTSVLLGRNTHLKPYSRQPTDKTCNLWHQLESIRAWREAMTQSGMRFSGSFELATHRDQALIGEKLLDGTCDSQSVIVPTRFEEYLRLRQVDTSIVPMPYQGFTKAGRGANQTIDCR